MNHVGQNSLCTNELGREVGLDYALPEIEVHLRHQLVSANACVVDQNVDPSRGVVQLRDCTLNIVLRGHTHLLPEDFSTQLLQFGGCLRQCYVINVPNGDATALTGQVFGYAQADAICPTGHYGGQSLERVWSLRGGLLLVVSHGGTVV